MSKPSAPFLVPPRQIPQLQTTNENIAKLAAVEPYGDLYSTFALAAQLASEAIAAAKELQQMPEIDRHAFDQECNRLAALDCAGGNQSLAEALVTFRLFRNIGK